MAASSSIARSRSARGAVASDAILSRSETWRLRASRAAWAGPSRSGGPEWAWSFSSFWSFWSRGLGMGYSGLYVMRCCFSLLFVFTYKLNGTRYPKQYLKQCSRAARECRRDVTFEGARGRALDGRGRLIWILRKSTHDCRDCAPVRRRLHLGECRERFMVRV